jgi:hypothetical protein
MTSSSDFYLCYVYPSNQKCFNKTLIDWQMTYPQKKNNSFNMTISRLPERHYSWNHQCSCESLVSSISLVSIAEDEPMDDFTNRPHKRQNSLKGWGTAESRKSYKRGLHELIESNVKSSRRRDDATKQVRCLENKIIAKDTWGFYVEN